MKQSELKLVQSELKSKGYYSGGVDGLSGPKTRAAVHQFLSDNTGQLSAERWTEWNNARIPRIIIEEGDRQTAGGERQEGSSRRGAAGGEQQERLLQLAGIQG